MQLAQGLAKDTAEARRGLPSGLSNGAAAAPVGASPPEEGRREALASALRELEPELALKLRTLLIAGRDRRGIGAVNANASSSDAEAGLAKMAADSGDDGPLLIDYLQRGHAIACATGIDLEGPFADWQASAGSLDDRAWLSFGKQLASSDPGDWQCIGIVDPETRDVSKLYLKLGDHAWWSFQSVIDRPTLASVAKDQRALSRRRVKGMSTNSLQSLVGRFESSRGRALRRAARAIRARVGQGEAAAR